MITIHQLVDIIKESIEETPGYHGSGADFDRFNHKKYLGSGCGSQRFGWGTYITDDKAIGTSYAQHALSQKSKSKNMIPDYVTFKNGKKITIDDICKICDIRRADAEPIIKILYDYSFDFQSLLNIYSKTIKQLTEDKDNPFYKDEYCIGLYTFQSEIVSKLKEICSVNRDKMNPDDYSYLYQVDIPENNGDNYLDWYEPIDDVMIDKIISGFNNLPQRFKDAIVKDNKYDNLNKGLFKSKQNGEDIYKLLRRTFGSDKAVGLFLLNCCGIQGITYPAGTKVKKPQGASDNARNYVLFDINGPQITNKKKYYYGVE